MPTIIGRRPVEIPHCGTCSNVTNGSGRGTPVTGPSVQYFKAAEARCCREAQGKSSGGRKAKPRSATRRRLHLRDRMVGPSFQADDEGSIPFTRSNYFKGLLGRSFPSGGNGDDLGTTHSAPRLGRCRALGKRVSKAGWEFEPLHSCQYFKYLEIVSRTEALMG